MELLLSASPVALALLRLLLHHPETHTLVTSESGLPPFLPLLHPGYAVLPLCPVGILQYHMHSLVPVHNAVLFRVCFQSPVPVSVSASIPFSKKIGYTTDQIIALKKTVDIKPEETAIFDLIVSVGYDKEQVIKNMAKFMNNENTKRTFELLKAKSEAENRYLGIKGKDIEVYQKMLSYLLFTPKVSIKASYDRQCPVSELWKYGISGDLPILMVKIKDINDIDIPY